MGFFGSDTQTVAITQSASGQATAEVEVKMPLWEILLIAVTVSVIVFVVLTWLKKCIEKKVAKTIQKNSIVQNA